jgi:hypothetical protein
MSPQGDIIKVARHVKMLVWATSSVKKPGTTTRQPGESKSEKKGLCQPSGTAPGYGMILKSGLSGVTSHPCNKRRMGHPLLYQGKKSDFGIWSVRPNQVRPNQ